MKNKENISIVISGTVGVGKSSVCSLLKKLIKERNLKVNLLKEKTVKSVYLDLFYKKPEKWAFISQLDWLMERFKQWLENERDLEEVTEKTITIYDRHFLDDYIFAEMHVSRENITLFNALAYQNIYKELLEIMINDGLAPTYFILLKCPLDVVMGRLNKRGRQSEVDTEIRYWKELHKNYYEIPKFQHHFKSNSKYFIEIETENKSLQEIAKEIENKIFRIS